MSLRKKKTTEIINAKRRRLVGTDSKGTESKSTPGGGIGQHYKGYEKYEKNNDEYNQQLGLLCPEVIQNRMLTIVSDFLPNLSD